ncbi:alkane 1-monooxygenase [Solimonas terrae]|uniref:Alkane 1-monooxygenase n=1 Tax=Solimonas terrae TaxID=1396819 RepID=A0A6M2BW47_9GAMM|nr:alkane 1-monooxygenase [Solimonas terrae]NGY06431.1 alkane 1-monooxygenase [Solimonas terrae]
MTTATLAPVWRDNKRYLWPLGAVIMLIPIIAGLLYGLTGWGVWWWLGPIVVYGFIPLADWLVGTDTNNPPEAIVPTLERERYYRYAVYVAVVAEYAAVIWGAWTFVHGGLPWYHLVGLTITIGMITGVSINTAHELGHKTDPTERWLAKIALGPVAYGHFFTEHNRGHHVRVATPEDPASSRFGENFYEFLPRTMIGSLTSAWELERKRLERQGKGVWSRDNQNLQAWAITVVLFGALTVWLGWIVLPFLLIQAFYGASLLEVVNYLEHYGLKRQKRADGSYERCQPEHSWNSNHIVTNVFLYHLQRHSDHHANPTRSYQALRHFEQAPQLPSGYASMIVLAYIPPLWFKIMDPKVVAHYHGDMRLANIKPSRHDEVIARYAAQRSSGVAA